MDTSNTLLDKQEDTFMDLVVKVQKYIMRYPQDDIHMLSVVMITEYLKYRYMMINMFDKEYSGKIDELNGKWEERLINMSSNILNFMACVESDEILEFEENKNG